ncbi:MAG: hypothetical protein R2778_06495 [Saprospiraceae bacterium]
MAQQYFEGRQKQFREAAQTELLRDLTRKHLEAGKSVMEIADWLALPLDFVEKIALLLDRVSAHRDQTKHRQLISGNPSYTTAIPVAGVPFALKAMKEALKCGGNLPVAMHSSFSTFQLKSSGPNLLACRAKNERSADLYWRADCCEQNLRHREFYYRGERDYVLQRINGYQKSQCSI